MPSAASLTRRVTFIVLVIAVAAAAGLLVGTESGRSLLRDPHHHGQRVREWVDSYPLAAPVVFVTVYVALGALGLPVWWLQILAGYGFGVVMGIVWSQTGATLAALGASSLSRFLLGDWFHSRVESHAARLRALDEKLGHNGLLVVCAVRLAHFIPAGIANLALGLTTISLIDIAVGTLLGGIPTVATYVTIGAGGHLLADWQYLAALATLNVILLAPLVLRYLRPEWFRKMGIE